MLVTNDADLAQGYGTDFKHEPLPHPITHIRLLEVILLNDSRDPAIRCRLRCVRLADYDQCYIALSYTWSHHAAQETIYINGLAVSVRRNLYDFLQIYRQKLKNYALPAVFLWVDALCLDYGNIRERNFQVQIMPNIFQRATTVLAWLEPLPRTAETADACEGLDKFVAFLSRIREDLELPSNFQNDQLLIKKYTSTAQPAALNSLNEWSTLLRLCRHHYWSRLWILLETRFAQVLMFLHGDRIWSWADFQAPFVLMWYLTESKLYDPATSCDFDPSQILHTPAADVVRLRLQFLPYSALSNAQTKRRYADAATEKWQLTSTREPLPDLLKAHRHKLCANRVDRVYAIIGLSDSSLSVDYARSNIELFCAVLLSLQVSLELNFVSMLAHHLEVSAFQYREHRGSIIQGVSSTVPNQSAVDIVGSSCRTVFAVKPIPARTEISDILQARLGIQKLKHYRIAAQQSIQKMAAWDDFPDAKGDMPRIHGHTPGTNMPIVDGFDLSDTNFRAAMFLDPSNREKRKVVFGMVSTGEVQDGDILVADARMHSGIIIRISGLRKKWLTVIGVVLFARRVTVECGFSSPLTPSSPASTTRSATLGDFCEHTFPTPFTIIGCDGGENFTVKPRDVQLQRLSSGSSLSSTRCSGSIPNSTNTTKSSKFGSNDRRLMSRSDRIERIIEVISPRKRRNTK